VARVDFSMIEAMLWTMAEPLLAAQCGEIPTPRGNQSERHAVHDAFRCAGDDEWVAVAAETVDEWRRLRSLVLEREVAAWLQSRRAAAAAPELRRAGVPAAALASSRDLVADEHLHARSFWEACGGGVLPGLPWRASFGRRSGDAPGLGADTDMVLMEVLNLSAAEITSLRGVGALG
jgi:crotonobetainyl-CoA:carnitine CoA-transferase CaiB-like acyl-CoA transferase